MYYVYIYVLMNTQTNIYIIYDISYMHGLIVHLFTHDLYEHLITLCDLYQGQVSFCTSVTDVCTVEPLYCGIA